MPDFIGNVAVPEIAASGTWSVAPDFGYGRIHNPQWVTHQFGSGNAKIEQRFYLGSGAKRFLWRKQVIKNSERITIRDFLESRQIPYQPFTYSVPDEAGTGTTPFTVRCANGPLTWEFINQAACTIGLEFIEVPVSFPTYPVGSTQTRFPSASLPAALLSQVQEIIPLVKIQPRITGYPAIYISDRRCTVGGQLYQARLLDVPEIGQSLGGESDTVDIPLGNADRVMTLLVNDVDLDGATVEVSLFHVGTTIKLDLWKGEVVNWNFDAGNIFNLQASDNIPLNVIYPRRRISRTCWKDFNDGVNCPAASSGGTNLGTACDKGFDTAAGCVFHNMQNYFGGIIAKPQAVYTRDNSRGFLNGRPTLTSVSLVAESIYDQVLPEIYTDQAIPVAGKIVAGRDEGDFYVALALLSEGPIGAMDPGVDINNNARFHRLDGVPNHGPGNLGLRRGFGNDPAQDNNPDKDSDKFSLGQGGSGIQTYGTEKAAGAAFIEIRKSDEKGLQLSRLAEHSIQAWVSQGMSGWVWSAPGSRTSQAGLTNPVWIAVNVYLRGRNLDKLSAASQETYFDVTAAIAAAAICDTSVTKIVGSGSETQFKFIGVLQDEKSLKDWIQEILNNCVGDFLFSNGKLKISIRSNSSVVEAFTIGNIIFQSLHLEPNRPNFNFISANFADVEFEMIGNSVVLYDLDHAKRLGGSATPQYRRGTMNFAGAISKSQVARCLSIRMREELGGIYRSALARPYLEYDAARKISFKTTILGLAVEPGMVCSLTHDDMPIYQASNDGQAQQANYGEFRVKGWRLNKDYSVDVVGDTTHNDMYDLAVGPKPADVVADPVPGEVNFAPADWGFSIETYEDGILRINRLFCKTYPLTVYQALFEIYYVAEDENHFTTTLSNLTDSSTSLNYFGDPLVPGDYIMIDNEIMLVTDVVVTSPNNGTLTLVRGQLNTTAVAHNSSGATVSSVSAGSNAEFVIDTGLSINPGARLVPVTPAGNSQRLAGYNATTGAAQSVLPFSSLSAGQIFDIQQRIYRLRLRNEVVPFQPRFFKSKERATYEYLLDLPFAGVAAVRGYLDNTRGIRSAAVVKLPCTGPFPSLMRTLGTIGYSLSHPAVPTGSNLDLYESIRTARDQSVEEAHAELIGDGSVGQIINSPRSVGVISPANFTASGKITISGTISSAGRIQVFIGNGSTDRVFLQPSLFKLTTETTAAQVATALAAWLNADAEFAAYYIAVAASAVVNITDRYGHDGVMTTSVSGGVVATVAGLPSGTAMKSQLGILTGRRYAISFRDNSGGYESELSPVSQSSGPSGSAQQIEVRNIPLSDDARVDQRRIWAAPDGLHGPFYLVGTLADNVSDNFEDTQVESTLTAQTAWPGASLPAQSGISKITINMDGLPWCELRIPTTGSRGSITGVALGHISKDTLITADVDNQSGTQYEVKVLLN